ncbi:MAG TPA: phosphoglycerate mutase family protein [Pyrinomonadaceae bacterium]|nr:phosphoglycerate mutase family protein [Pyrinomonadaceae bacterium]
MKIVISFLFLVCVFIIDTAAQEKTILLVRHAEKIDDSQDPELSPQGKERAQRLVKTIGKYKPGGFFSTDFKRTRDTLAPLAAKREKKIEIYDPRKPQELIDTIMKSKTKRFVISGHSNTIPGLANLIAKKEVFRNLNDSEHSVIWLVRLKDGKVTRLELLDY